MMAVQSLSTADSRNRPMVSLLWIAALTASFAPWIIVAFKLLLVAADAPLALIEAAISAIFISIPISACAWLGSTALILVFGDWRRGALALTGLMPLGIIYFVTTAWLGR